jgi:hypothetical protein
LGNSHVAALKRAWDYMATDHPNCEVHFIARPHGQGGLRGLEIKEGILSPANNEKGFMFSNNKAGFVDLSVYDALIIVGCFPFVLKWIDIPPRFWLVMLKSVFPDPDIFFMILPPG